LDLEKMSLPSLITISGLKDQILDQGAYALMFMPFYTQILSVVVSFVGIYQLKRNWQLSLAGWALAILAFLPMAFLKMFEHYYYWPMALQTILTVAGGTVAVRLAAIAVSPPVRQAPARLDPAPGSLLHP
jgi:hypothetical protein